MKKIVVIGGGAAGFFAALSAKIHYPENEVIIYEKLNKVLSKVKISGGGRCNVTHACFDNKELASKYPRGENYLRKAFEQFNANDTIEWFKKRGILLKTYPDGCIFPQSNDSQTIIDCFLGEVKRLGVKVMMNQSIQKISKSKAGCELITQTSKINADKVIITTGGQPKKSGADVGTRWPSLFFRTRQGVVVAGICRDGLRALICQARRMVCLSIITAYLSGSGT
jgi:predicted Rossmann fold flavoprotein